MGAQAFRATILNPVSPSVTQIYDPGILVVEDGKISFVGQKMPDGFSGLPVEDLEGRVISPGFVDTHLHLPQFQFLGQGVGMHLLPWLNNYTFPAEMKFSDPNLAEKVAEDFFTALLGHGTTTCCAYSTVHEEATARAFVVAQRRGVRAFIGKVMMDRNAPEGLGESTQGSFDASVRLYKEWDGKNNGLLRYVFTPRFAPMCSPELMGALGDFIRKNSTYVQTHLSEDKTEIEWVKKLFPDCATYTDVYNKFGLLGRRTIMAHCIHLSDDEVVLLRDTETKVAHCPNSNRSMGHDTMPYFRLKDLGLTIGLGTDIAGGPSISMANEMREAIEASRKIDPANFLFPSEAFYLATMGGARVLGIEGRVGNLSVGKDADFIVSREPAGAFSAYAMIRALMVKGPLQVEKAYVRGNLVYANAGAK